MKIKTKPLVPLSELSKLSEQVNGLIARLDNLEEKFNTPLILPGSKLEVVSPKEVPQRESISQVSSGEVQYPVPLEYRQKADLLLNKNFDLKVEPRKDAPLFEFRVFVPDKYSSASREQKASLGGQDVRCKVVSYAEGLAGVQEYLEKIYESFNSEVRALITADR